MSESRKLDISSVVSRVIDGLRDDFEFACHRSVKTCEPLVESEIELMLLATFHMALSMTDMKMHIGSEFPDDSYHLLITPQYQWENYRIDFRLLSKGALKPIFVECDGHDFHERTKEQAERDRSKDRAIQAAGIPILRFTGREIWRDPSRIAAEIINFTSSRRGEEK